MNLYKIALCNEIDPTILPNNKYIEADDVNLEDGNLVFISIRDTEDKIVAIISSRNKYVMTLEKEGELK